MLVEGSRGVNGAHGRNRTGKGVKAQRILSPSRLPIPPRGHVLVILVEDVRKLACINLSGKNKT
jgi:hypothetical protein